MVQKTNKAHFRVGFLMGKQMGDAIKAAVLQTIVQEKRQGGLLAR